MVSASSYSWDPKKSRLLERRDRRPLIRPTRCLEDLAHELVRRHSHDVLLVPVALQPFAVVGFLRQLSLRVRGALAHEALQQELLPLPLHLVCFRVHARLDHHLHARK